MEEYNKLDLLGDIDDSFIVSAENAKKKPFFIKAVLPIAAALLLIAGTVFAVKSIKANLNTPDVSALTTDPAPVETDKARHSDEPGETEKPAVTVADLIKLGCITDEGVDSEYPPHSGTLQLKRALLVYEGRIYYEFCSVSPVKDPVGRELAEIKQFDLSLFAGMAADENEAVNASDAPAELMTADCELTGVMSGKLYAVKGMPEKSAVCMHGYDGETVVYVCEDGLNDGRALSEDVLGLSDNLRSVTYSSPSSAGKPGEFSRTIERENASESMEAFIAAISDGVWVDDQDEESTAERYFTVGLESGIEFYCRVLTGGMLRFGVDMDSLPGGKSLHVDKAKLQPLLDLMDRGEGNENELSYNRFYTPDDCRRNARFGALVPKMTLEGYWIRQSSIFPILDDDRKTVGTEGMWLQYKNPETDAVINVEYFPISKLESESEFFIENGGTVKKLSELESDDVISITDDNCLYCVVTADDSVISAEGIDALPEEVYGLLKSIIN